MNPRQSGFTLVEAIVVLAIIAIGMGIAVPAYSSAAAASATGAARIDLAETLLVALNESTLTGSDVVVCSSNNASSCSGDVDWSQGWIAFDDLDDNRTRGPDETVIRRHAPLAGSTHLRSTAQRTRIVFQAHGGVNAGSNVTFTLCDARGPDKATTLVLANSGRMRQGTPTAAAARACLTSG